MSLSNEILAKYHNAGRLTLAQVRKDFAHVSRATLDATLIQMQLDGEVVLMHMDDPQERTSEHVAAEINISGSKRHIIYVKATPQQASSDSELAAGLVELLYDETEGMAVSEIARLVAQCERPEWPAGVLAATVASMLESGALVNAGTHPDSGQWVKLP